MNEYLKYLSNITNNETIDEVMCSDQDLFSVFAISPKQYFRKVSGNIFFDEESLKNDMFQRLAKIKTDLFEDQARSIPEDLFSDNQYLIECFDIVYAFLSDLRNPVFSIEDYCKIQLNQEKGNVPLFFTKYLEYTDKISAYRTGVVNDNQRRCNTTATRSSESFQNSILTAFEKRKIPFENEKPFETENQHLEMLPEPDSCTVFASQPFDRLLDSAIDTLLNNSAEIPPDSDKTPFEETDTIQPLSDAELRAELLQEELTFIQEQYQLLNNALYSVIKKLGNVYDKYGNERQALRYWKEALLMNPSSSDLKKKISSKHKKS